LTPVGTRRALLEHPSQSLAGADLRGASLVAANLRGADLTGADLRGAALAEADLERATLDRADLRGANLSGAGLASQSLLGADFRGADLRGAEFGGRGLGRHVFSDPLWQVRLEGALYDDTTRWPAGFTAETRGCVRCERPEPQGEQSDLPIPSDVSSDVTSLPVPSARTGDVQPVDSVLVSNVLET
jgi:hypothetical protein